MQPSVIMVWTTHRSKCTFPMLHSGDCNLCSVLEALNLFKPLCSAISSWVDKNVAANMNKRVKVPCQQSETTTKEGETDQSKQLLANDALDLVLGLLQRHVGRGFDRKVQLLLVILRLGLLSGRVVRAAHRDAGVRVFWDLVHRFLQSKQCCHLPIIVLTFELLVRPSTDLWSDFPARRLRKVVDLEVDFVALEEIAEVGFLLRLRGRLLLLGGRSVSQLRVNTVGHLFGDRLRLSWNEKIRRVCSAIATLSKTHKYLADENVTDLFVVWTLTHKIHLQCAFISRRQHGQC